MTERGVTVTCPDCDLRERFEGLGAARERVEAHRREAGHEPDWEIGRLSAGVERAGADAGVCGRPACANANSPLVRGRDGDGCGGSGGSGGEGGGRGGNSDGSGGTSERGVGDDDGERRPKDPPARGPDEG